MKSIIITKVKQLLVIIKKTMSDIVKAPEEDLVVVEANGEDGQTETRYASIEDTQAKKEAAKIPDYSKGIKVNDGETIVTIFTQERDVKDFVEQAEAFAAEHGYTVSE